MGSWCPPRHLRYRLWEKAGPSGYERRVVATQIHAGIVVDIRFRDSYPAGARDLCQQRQRDQPVTMEAAHRPHLVVVFIGGLETVEHQRVQRRIFAVPELSTLTSDVDVMERWLLRNDIAKRYAVVEGSYLDG